MRKNLLSWDETLFRDIDVFDPGYVPDQFDYRDTQTQALAFAIRPGLRGGKILNTVCRGPPGTGKTTTVKKIFELIEETTREVVPVHINCQMYASEYAVMSRIYTQLTKNRQPPSGTSFKQITDTLARHVEREHIQPLICLDDANYLIYENQFNKILYPLLRMHESYPSVNFGLIVIISDPEIDLARVLEVRVASTFHPEVVQFPPYSSAEISGILDARIRQGLYPHVFPAGQLDAVVEYVMQSGDVRLGLEMVKRAVLYAENDARKTVEAGDVEKTVAALTDSRLGVLIHALTPDERLVLSAAVALFTDTSSPTTKEVLDSLPENGPKLTRASEIFTRLDTLRLIDLQYSNTGDGRKRYVHLHYDKEVMKRILEQDAPAFNQ